MLDELKGEFPVFHSLLQNANPEECLPGIGEMELEVIENDVGCQLPDSYRSFLQVCRGIWLFGGSVQFGLQHPFMHNFPKLEDLNPKQLSVIKQRGRNWPPPSKGMLCFAEYFLEDDGDQVLFKIDDGLRDGEYSVYYYAHSDVPASVRKLSDSFIEFMECRCIQLFNEQ